MTDLPIEMPHDFNAVGATDKETVTAVEKLFKTSLVNVGGTFHCPTTGNFRDRTGIENEKWVEITLAGDKEATFSTLSKPGLVHVGWANENEKKTQTSCLLSERELLKKAACTQPAK